MPDHSPAEELRAAAKLWPWQVPGASFFAWDGAYELAHAAPARARASGERDGRITYLIAAHVRGVTQGEGGRTSTRGRGTVKDSNWR